MQVLLYLHLLLQKISIMSSFKKRQKTLKRTHRERGQLSGRKHLGLLEKHKDYVLRARDYHKKQLQLKVMQEKARNRNPDEFYYKMVNTKLKDGRHVISQPDMKYTPEELHLMKTQDHKYIQMKLMTETKKIERLQANLHQTRTHKKLNHHTIFVDSIEEVSAVAKQVTEEHQLLKESRDEISLEAGTTSQECAASYKELNQRMQRCKDLTKIAVKMKTQKELMAKGKRIKMPGDGVNPATYKWKKERKK